MSWWVIPLLCVAGPVLLALVQAAGEVRANHAYAAAREAAEARLRERANADQ